MIFISLAAFTVVLGIIAIFTHRKLIGKLVLLLWSCFFALIFLGIGADVLLAKKEVEKTDIYGTYVVDRGKFSGKQADWQYSHYYFELTPQNKILFHVADKGRVVKTDTGTISFVNNYMHPHLKIAMPQPAHHLIDSIPTLYVGRWSFYYVFSSTRYGNVFFKKGQWKPLDK